MCNNVLTTKTAVPWKNNNKWQVNNKVLSFMTVDYSKIVQLEYPYEAETISI